MNRKNVYALLTAALLSSPLISYYGLRSPPEQLQASDIPSIGSTSTDDSPDIELTQAEIKYWSGLEFEISGNRYPGETPDFIRHLKNTDGDTFTAMYNRNSEFVFFRFASEVGYGIFNSPSPGGWTQPLYTTPRTEELLALLRVEDTQ